MTSDWRYPTSTPNWWKTGPRPVVRSTRSRPAVIFSSAAASDSLIRRSNEPGLSSIFPQAFPRPVRLGNYSQWRKSITVPFGPTLTLAVRRDAGCLGFQAESYTGPAEPFNPALESGIPSTPPSFTAQTTPSYRPHRTFPSARHAARPLPPRCWVLDQQRKAELYSPVNLAQSRQLTAPVNWRIWRNCRKVPDRAPDVGWLCSSFSAAREPEKRRKRPVRIRRQGAGRATKLPVFLGLVPHVRHFSIVPWPP